MTDFVTMLQIALLIATVQHNLMKMHWFMIYILVEKAKINSI